MKRKNIQINIIKLPFETSYNRFDSIPFAW